MTPSLHDADPKGDIFGRTIYPLSLTVIAYILANLWRGKQSAPPSPLAPVDKKNDSNFCKADRTA